MTDNDMIYKRTARRIIDSPRSREQMLAVLEGTPPIVEIIRCLDCKYYDEVNQPYPQMYCRKHSIDTSDKDFCSAAERKDDE